MICNELILSAWYFVVFYKGTLVTRPSIDTISCQLIMRLTS